ncbi:MAG TPA: sugar ABC transporter ATP-binding protein [Terriglobia bacterium]|nr:sugar ABC transporter ATP-binding protein [Terriglobia bacterium]
MTEPTHGGITAPHSLPLVKLRAIRKSFAGVPVLKGAHMGIAPGEIHGLVGENGAGKSTLMKILGGEIHRDAGEVSWLGEAASLASRTQAEALGITMIHQELNLAQHLSVAENIFLGHEPGQSRLPGVLDRRREAADATACLEKLGFKLNPRTAVRYLSLAQRQLVEIARAVFRTQRLVIMDEPTSSLSIHEVEDLFRVVRQLKTQGTAVVFVTHRLEELAQIADRVTVLRDGETVHEGPMPASDFGELIRAMVGRELKDFYPARQVQKQGVLFAVEGLSRKNKFQGVNFSISGGEIVGLAGLVGAGRTEVAETIFGAVPADHGRIFVDGAAVRMRTPMDAIRCGMALITEDRKRTGLAGKLSVGQNITMANLRALLRHGCLDLKKEEQVGREFLQRLDIRAASIVQKVERLSGGNQQKVVLAKWLFRQARIFLFDEPTRGVDVGAKSEIYRLINELAQSGAAILMISSELPEILGMTDRVLVMRNGRVVKELVTAETTQEEIMRWATLEEA